MLSNLKRKAHVQPFTSRKNAKSQCYSVNELPWTLSKPPKGGANSSADDGIIELEEVENVEVIYEETETGRVARFKVVGEPESEFGKEPSCRPDEHDPVLEGDRSGGLETDSEAFDASTLLPNWPKCALHPHLLRRLHEMDFLSPTPIQAEAIPFALAGRDVVGVAETGSGKTLAYGLPILHRLLSQPRHPESRRSLKALILAPTRELALQVSSHLNACLGPPKTLVNTEVKTSRKAPPLVSVAALVGGMSQQKQRRILQRGVDILVATPGRLWDIMDDDDRLAEEIKDLKFLVLDEADRMIEAGHFAELDNILRLTRRPPRDDDQDETESADNVGESTNQLQTFVFSATLSKDLQRNLKRIAKTKTGPSRKNIPPSSTLDDLLLRLDFRDKDPQIIDISPANGVVSSLKESRIDCLSADKDVYLYYFLLRYPGRSLVFLASIDGIRRLMPLMELLAVKAFPLHSQLEQRQRLKNLDRFKATPNSVLLATDIAARGLDIPAVDHVIHYQIPRSADSYIHRNGRTARATRKGFSMLMCAPDERRVLRALLASLGRHDNDIAEMAVGLDFLDKLKARVRLAREIDQSQHKIRKEKHDRNWMKETAEAMELELDSDFASETDEDRPSKKKQKAVNHNIAAMKAELKDLLSQPLIARGISARYITSGSAPIVDDLLAGEHHEVMLGVKKAEAGDELVAMKRKKGKKKKERVKPKLARS